MVSDKEGKFSLVVPDGMKQELVISHISYQTSKIPYDVYSKKTSLQLTLKEKTCDLSDITVVSGKKLVKRREFEQYISHKLMI